MGEHPHFAQEGRAEAEFAQAHADILGRIRRLAKVQRGQQHEQDVGRRAVVEQRKDRRVGAVAAIPVGLAVDHHGAVDVGQAGRGEQRVDRQFMVVEDAQLARVGVGRRDEQLDRAVLAQTLEIDLRRDDVAQGVEVERVQLLGREILGPLQHQLERGRDGRRLAAGIGGAVGEGRAFGNGGPEIRQRFAGAVASAAHQPLRQADGVHRPGAGAADTLEAELAVFEQRVEYAPGEGAVRAAALQGKIDRGMERTGERHENRAFRMVDRNRLPAFVWRGEKKPGSAGPKERERVSLVRDVYLLVVRPRPFGLVVCLFSVRFSAIWCTSFSARSTVSKATALMPCSVRSAVSSVVLATKTWGAPGGDRCRQISARM